MTRHPNSSQRGSSLLELLVAMGILSIVLAAMFGLLDGSQLRLTAEQDFVPAVQAARAGVDIIMKDIHNAGYPSPFLYTNMPNDPSTAPPSLDLYRRFSVGFVGLASQTCQPGVSCTVPNGFDLLLETNPDANSAAYKEQVQWVEYRLVRPAGSATGTLMRSMIPKTAGVDPIANAQLTPLILNVLNDPTNAADAIFTYSCGPVACATPNDIKQVQINVRVQSYRMDIKTRQFRTATMTALAQKTNPSY